MTREEAKFRLLGIERCTPIHTREDVRDFEALEMAIKALEQEPCEDAISRDAVWNVMQELWGTSGELLDRLMALPPVNPTKTGHWIKHDGYWECSECHAERAYGNEYCPDCGSHNGDIAKPFKKSEVSE